MAKKRKQPNNIKSFFIIAFAMLLAGITAFNLFLATLPPIENLKTYTPNLVSSIVASDGSVIKTFASFKYKKAEFSEMPEELKKAIIATEDRKFYKHHGFDIYALVRSTAKNLTEGEVVQGASTITQQLARILFLNREKTFDRKFKELILANRIEKSISKDDILGMYLNSVYLGEGAYGVSAAADVYFNKRLSQLTLAECALLAGLPQAPSVYSPFQNPKLAKERRNQVLKGMLKMNYITKDEYENAIDEPIRLSDYRAYAPNNSAPYFVNHVMGELKELGYTEQEISMGGFKIVTTLDSKAQQAAEKSLKRNLRSWGMTAPNEQAALFSYNANTGKILAYVGGKDYSESQFDRVTQAVRPPGSSFKIFVYTAAMERGYTPETKVLDTPFHVADWSPRNYGNRYRSQIPLSTALAHSSNVVAARLIMDVGVGETIRMARRMGITTPLANDPTIALGSSGVKLFEMTNAYGVLANGGVKVKPYSIERIETSKGKILYNSNGNYNERILDIRTVGRMVSMMQKVITSGTGVAARIGRPCAGKTGTTDDYRDAWFIGFTPEIVTGVWVGNDDNKPTAKLTGGSVPAVIWRDYMKVATADSTESEFNNPEMLLKSDGTSKPFGSSSKDLILDINNPADRKIIDNIDQMQDIQSVLIKVNGKLYRATDLLKYRNNQQSSYSSEDGNSTPEESTDSAYIDVDQLKKSPTKASAPKSTQTNASAKAKYQYNEEDSTEEEPAPIPPVPQMPTLE